MVSLMYVTYWFYNLISESCTVISFSVLSFVFKAES